MLYKGNIWNDFTDIYLLSYDKADTNKDTWNAWELQYPDDYPSINTWQPLMDLIDFCSNKTTDEDFEASYHDYFYIDNLTDYIVFTLALHVGDNMYKNTFLSVIDITDGHRYMISPWDMDMSLGGRWDGKYDEGLSDINQYNDRAPFNRLIGRNMGGFVSKLTDTWTTFYTTLFAPDNISRRLDYYANLFETSGAWEREFNKWDGNPVQLKAKIEEETDYVKKWYVRNYENLCYQFGTLPAAVELNGADNSEYPYYDLYGRQFETEPASGLYIHDGMIYLRR